MKRTVDSLTIAEKEALAHIYELKPTYKALVKLCQVEITALGVDSMLAGDMETVKYYAGQAKKSKDLPVLIRDLYKETHSEG